MPEKINVSAVKFSRNLIFVATLTLGIGRYTYMHVLCTQNISFDENFPIYDTYFIVANIMYGIIMLVLQGDKSGIFITL